jgi:hypothetical protein
MSKTKAVNRFIILIYFNIKEPLNYYCNYSFIFKMFIIINLLISKKN